MKLCGEIHLPRGGYKSFHPDNVVPVGASFDSAYRLHFCSDRVQYSTAECVTCHGINGRMWRHLHIWRLEQQYPGRSPRIICWPHMTQDRLNTRLSPYTNCSEFISSNMQIDPEGKFFSDRNRHALWPSAIPRAISVVDRDGADKY